MPTGIDPSMVLNSNSGNACGGCKCQKSFPPPEKQSSNFDIENTLIQLCKEVIYFQFVKERGYNFTLEDIAFDLEIKNKVFSGEFRYNR